MELSARYSEAIEYARIHHAEDVRKGTAIPYLAHVIAVSAIVLEHGGDEADAIAALLHDVVEDGGGQRALGEIAERFGSDAAAIVEGCSDTTADVKEDWELRKTRYLHHLETAADSILLVSAADKLHNARSILGDLREHGPVVWERFNRGPRDQLWYYGSLAEVFLRRSPGRLADELDRTVRAIRSRIDPDDQVEWLRFPFELWTLLDGRQGAIIDWPGWPLIVDFTGNGPVVRAEVGIGGDYCSDADPDLDEYLDHDLEGATLSYDMNIERAWLTCRSEGDLHEACERVARLAPGVAAGLKEVLDFDEPSYSYAAWIEKGPL